MSKVITFSRVFPSYHIRKGEETYFVEKILKSIGTGYDYCVHPYHYDGGETKINTCFYNLNPDIKNIVDDFIGFSFNDPFGYEPKHHTIRAGNRWKVGDKFSPRVWSGKPYNSKQITIAPDIEIVKVLDFEIKEAYKMLPLDYDTDIIINHNFYHSDDKIMKQIAANDGLTLSELLQWFKYPKPFKGQIICWNPNVNY